MFRSIIKNNHNVNKHHKRIIGLKAVKATNTIMFMKNDRELVKIQ
jgi:hypothetical protein